MDGSQYVVVGILHTCTNVWCLSQAMPRRTYTKITRAKKLLLRGQEGRQGAKADARTRAARTRTRAARTIKGRGRGRQEQGQRGRSKTEKECRPTERKIKVSFSPVASQIGRTKPSHSVKEQTSEEPWKETLRGVPPSLLELNHPPMQQSTIINDHAVRIGRRLGWRCLGGSFMTNSPP